MPASGRAALCRRTLLGHALSLPIVLVLGALVLVSVMGDPKPGAPLNRGQGHLLVALVALVGLQGAIPILALRSLRREHPEVASFRAPLLACASMAGWVAGLFLAAALSTFLPVWLDSLSVPLLACPAAFAVAGVYIASLRTRGASILAGDA
jgi:hypothetical protein